jgi:transcription-repair coupling factor (superfamily II helicase)
VPSRNLLLDAVASCPQVRALVAAPPPPGSRSILGGVIGSLASAVVACLHRQTPGRVLIAVAEDPQAAIAAHADLEVILEREGESYLYPQKEALPYEESEPHIEIGGLRVEAVEALFSGRVRLLVTTSRALQERVPLPTRLAELRRTFRVGDRVDFASIPRLLEELGFERVPLVEEVGQFAVRGGILDVFSVAAGDAVRIEFWDDEIASIRLFDILDQRSTAEVQETHVLPTDFRREALRDEGTVSRSLLELIPADAIVVRLGGHDVESEVARTWARVSALYQALLEAGSRPASPETLFVPPEEMYARLAALPRLDLLPGTISQDAPSLGASPPPPIDRDMERLLAYLREGAARGERTLLLCDNDGQLARLEEILGGPSRIPPGTSLGIGTLAGGFELASSDPPLRVLNDHEIFRRPRRVRRSRRFRGAVALESLAQLAPGDYVVHMDHGIGRFVGLEHIDVAGEEIEALALEYEGGEILRVPVHRLDLVERWVGETEDAAPPRLHRIGGKRWKALKKKTERAIEEMTLELLELYARREATQGFAFSPDTRWQMEMESSFLYDDTPDQRQAAEDVKRDMESTRPMDRLLCGDVGYGKTEVAIRAAFKAVQDGKQVAVLAPTTILVEQHRHTFAQRLADYPVRVGALSRFRTPKEQSELLAALADGSLDIVIGTHRLLSADVVFKDLGLLIIDEEQRFGVKHKERLKQMRATVHVLSLTATPIPRTLYLSLSGIRDLSIIRTPPRDRMPIITNVLPWSDQILADALHRELDRGGQTFFLHNRLDTIYTAADTVRELVPEARVAVAHGQMNVRDLDEVMRAFVDGEVDVLVCSSIIENGLDVPNANTLIVDRADRFGLAQLYQIRGRVGRSDRRAYCYLIVPDELGEDAERRLRVLEHYTELGSGYSIALKDLELRGAGNLLGAEQSGFAQQIGLDAYMRLLTKTVDRIRRGAEAVDRPDPEVSIAGAAYLPDSYVSDSGQKLHVYRRLSKVDCLAELDSLRLELLDRFGQPPPEVECLLDAVALRVLGRAVGAERILVRGRSARVNFRPDVMPRLAALDVPLRQRRARLEIRRVHPLSVAIEQEGEGPVAETLKAALDALRTTRSAAA